MLNIVNICGRLTADPELKKTVTSNKSVVSFSLAVERDHGEKKTDFFNCVAWGTTAEFISRYFSKGRMMIVSGCLQTRQYTASDGAERRVTEVVAGKVYFAGDKPKTAETGAQGAETPLPAYPESGFTEINEMDGDLPF